jgi:hypothetical protein
MSVFDLRKFWVRRSIGYATVACWVLAVQLWIMAITGRPLGGEWSRVLVLSLLIMAALGTGVLALAQVAIMAVDAISPMTEAVKLGYEIGRRDGETNNGGPKIVHLAEPRRPSLPVEFT